MADVEEAQHILLCHGGCARALTNEFPDGLDDLSSTPRELIVGGRGGAFKSAVVTCSTAEGARCVLRALLGMKEGRGWGGVQGEIERVEETVDASWAGVLSLFALLVQKYKYWHKSTNALLAQKSKY